jgi:hypothetical protein
MFTRRVRERARRSAGDCELARKAQHYPRTRRAARRSAPTWSIYRLKASPAALVGVVQAADANSAIKAAIEQYRVPPRYQQRLFAA